MIAFTIAKTLWAKDWNSVIWMIWNCLIQKKCNGWGSMCLVLLLLQEWVRLSTSQGQVWSCLEDGLSTKAYERMNKRLMNLHILRFWILQSSLGTLLNSTVKYLWIDMVTLPRQLANIFWFLEDGNTIGQQTIQSFWEISIVKNK